MYKFLTNLIRVKPSERELPVLVVSETPRELDYNKFVHVVNKYSNSFVSTPLLREYMNLKPGVYIASIGKYMGKAAFTKELRIALKKYCEETTREEPAGKRIEFGEIEVSEENISSSGYVVANLLTNALDKILQQENIRCYEVGVRLCVQLDKKHLEEILGEGWKNDPLYEFCKNHPDLCEEKRDKCSEFFKVVKQFHVRFQHSVINNDEKIYMIFSSHYRRLNYLNLKNIIEISQISPKALLGVRVNRKVRKKAEEYTELCEIVDVKEAEEAREVLIMECGVGGEKREQITARFHELENYNINPTYKASRNFIRNYLCDRFDAHKTLSRDSKETPNIYFELLKRDLVVFKKLINKYLQEKGYENLALGGIVYAIDEDLVKV